MTDHQHFAEGERLVRRRWANARDVSRVLPIPLSSLYDHARSGRIPGVVRVGRRVLFDLDKLDEWLGQGGETRGGGSHHN